MGNLSRRTLVKGTAWAVPAVNIGVSAPAIAASTVCDPATTPPSQATSFTVDGDGQHGDNGTTNIDQAYSGNVTIANTGTVDIPAGVTLTINWQINFWLTTPIDPATMPDPASLAPDFVAPPGGSITSTTTSYTGIGYDTAGTSVIQYGVQETIVVELPAMPAGSSALVHYSGSQWQSIASNISAYGQGGISTYSTTSVSTPTLYQDMGTVNVVTSPDPCVITSVSFGGGLPRDLRIRE